MPKDKIVKMKVTRYSEDHRALAPTKETRLSVEVGPLRVDISIDESGLLTIREYGCNRLLIRPNASNAISISTSRI